MSNGTQETYHAETYPSPPPVSAPSPDREPASGDYVAPSRARPGLRKSPFLACVLSLLPGVGQVYVGYYKLGFVHNLVFAGTIMLLSLEIEALAPLFGVFLAFFFVYNVVDAGRRAALYNLALDGVEGIELPEETNLELPSFGGSMAGGLLLMVIGGMLLSHTALGLSLDWVEAWWPVAPIALGAYLFIRALQERRQTEDEVEAAETE